MDFSKLHKIYFLGVGGIGMSALARYFLWLGKEVSGYDRTDTALTMQLEKEGVKVNYIDTADHVPDEIDLVIYTPAIPKNSKQFLACIEKGIPLMKRSEVLEVITSKYKVIAVAGTHGKTTVTSIIAHLFKKLNINFLAFIGGIPTNYQTNFLQFGEPEWVLVEADEYDRSFLKLFPDIALITSMDADHLDIYGDLDQMRESFRLFAGNIKQGGILVKRADLKGFNLQKASEVEYGIGIHSGFSATDITVEGSRYTCSFVWQDNEIPVVFQAVGRHNLENALAAYAVAVAVGVDPEKAANALSDFHGVKRRFEKVVETPDMVYIDDYAHHPEELRACIQSVRELYPGKKITGVFQPHLYSRTRDLAAEFGKSLSLLDKAVVMDIYPARELPIEGIGADTILRHVNIVEKFNVPDNELLDWISANRSEVLLTLGAGNIDRFVEPIKNLL